MTVSHKFSFVHISDLHLDSPFRGLVAINDQLAAKLKEATFQAFEKAINLCIDKKVSFLLIAGDIHDGADRSLRAQLRFRKGLTKLSEAGIQTFIVHGNHDPLDGWIAKLSWPEKVYRFNGDSVESQPVIKEGKEIARIYGISFRTRDIKKNLARQFKKEKTSPFAVGLLHCNVGSDTGHEPYAPCTIEDLVNTGMDYWALGHVHTRQKLHDLYPMIIYPGNSQGRNPLEMGARGCYFIEVDTQEIPHETFVAVDVIRWAASEISISDIEDEEGLLKSIENNINLITLENDSRDVILNLTFSGMGSINSSLRKEGFIDDLLIQLREDYGSLKPFVWVNKIIVSTREAVDLKSKREAEDFLGEVLRITENYRQVEEQTKKLFPELKSLFESGQGRKLLSALTVEQIKDCLTEAEAICLNKLTEEKEP